MRRNQRKFRDDGRLAAFALTMLLGGLAACGTLPAEPEPGGAGSELEPASIHLASLLGCRLDDDCAAGSFCFQRACVWECRADEDCGSGTICSARSRCIQPAIARSALREAGAPSGGIAVDESGSGGAATSLQSIEVLEWPPVTVEVLPGQPFVTVPLRTAVTLPGGALLYSVTTRASQGVPQAFRAEGETSFALILPAGKAGGDDPEVEIVQISTPMGSRTLFLVPARPRGGRYGGTFTPAVFGGAGLPLEFVVQTIPDDVTSLREASDAFVWLPTSSEFLVSLATESEQASFVRRPLVYDDGLDAWVATFAEELGTESYFGRGVFPGAQRSLRIEILEESGGSLHGALADRWYGLFERRTADGVASDGMATVSGYFELQRFDDLPALAGVREGQGETRPPAAAPPPSLGACDDAIFAFGDGEDAAPCGAIESAADFAAADAESRATCALAVADRALAGPTIGSMLQALLDPDQPNPGGMSFRSFIEACASDGDPLCTPTQELLCARNLVAHSYRDADATGATIARLAASYDTATKEAFVGRQLAAFHVDTQSRLKWLQSSEAPPFLASTLRDYNEQLLRTWQADVLDAHLAGVFGQLDAAGLAVLARATTDPVALAKRKAMLLDLANSWRAAMDALVVLTQRWNVLHQGDTQRAASTAYVRRMAFRLYTSAAIMQEISRNVGSTYLVSEFGAGFSGLMRELARLSLPFDRLIYARDAEVVASRSLDPREDSRSLLGEAEEAARKAIADASASVDLVLDEAQRTEVDEATLAGRYEDQLLSLRNELIGLCGLPAGCTPADVGADPLCQIPTGVGRCGFSLARGSSEAALPLDTVDRGSISEAGDALLSLQAALFGALESEERLRAHAQVAALTGETVEAFAEKVAQWDDQRRGVALEVETILGEIASLKDAQIDRALATLQAQQQLRNEAYASQRSAVNKWDSIRVAGVDEDMRRLGAIAGLSASSSALGFSAGRLDLMAEIIKKSMPEIVGPATDPSFVARMGVRFPAFIASSIFGSISQGLSAIAGDLEVQLARTQAVRDAKLSNLEDLAALGVQATENQLADLEQKLETLQLQSERKTASLQALIEALRRNLALDMAHERDLMELRDRRDAWRIQIVDAMLLEYQLAQADLTVRQREHAYYAQVQQAQLLEGRFRNMQIRWQSLDGLLGSPDVLFSFANRMARAESRLDRARRALEEWLVSLEYYAVRPFVNERLAILLARNPSQLEAIANEFSRLQMVCGGPSTLETVDVSLRDDLLGMSFASSDGEGSVFAPDERFRALLARSETTLQGRVIHSARETVIERLDRGNVWAVSFDVDIEGFANLARTCNAKIDSIAVQLVGEGLVGGLPVVSVVHHGASQLRSCQPGIAAYAASLGPKATSFGPVTAFRTAGRMISPITGIHSFGDAKAWNATLEGIPFSSSYTVLIDLDHPSNAAIDWDLLEDIRLQFRFTYQDVFPEGQCE